MYCFKYYIHNMALHDKKLPKNSGEDFQGIENKINKKPDLIAKYREEIMNILKNNEAEETDKTTLSDLIKKLKHKKWELWTDLWKTPPYKIDLSNNTEVTNFWKSIVNNSNTMILWKPLDWWWSPTTKEKKDINKKIERALQEIQFVHVDWSWTIIDKKFRLFKWASTDMTKIATTSSNPLISYLLTETDETKVDKHVEDFVDSVKSRTWKNWWWNPFYISSTKLDEKGKDEERKVAMRIALYLYCVYKIVNPDTKKWDTDKFSKALCKDINDKLDQIINNEIPKIKWLHNAKVELWYLEPEYETLKELNKKKWSWEINKGSHSIWSTPLSLPIVDLTWEYESWAPITANIDEYRIIENKVTITDAWWTKHKTAFIDWMWNTGDLFSKLNSKATSVDFCIEISWHKIKIWKLTLSNISWKAELKIDIDNEATINAAFTTAWVPIPAWPFNFEIPVKWIKNVSNWLKWCKASLTKPVKFKISKWWGGWGWWWGGWGWWWGGWGWWWGGWGWWWGSWGIKAKEWTATISSVEKVHSEEAAYLAEEKDREDFDKLWELSLLKISTWHPWSRMKHFISREHKRNKAIKKHMQAVKGRIDIRRESVVNASNRHELEHSDDKWKWWIDEKYIKHENADVNRLCVEYLKTDMKDADFEKKFNEIIAHDMIIGDIIRDQKMNYLWSNILLKLKQERAEQVMMDKIWRLLLEDVNATTLKMKDSYDETKFKSELKNISDEYFKATQSNFPPEIRKLLDNSHDKNLMLPILQNWKAQLQANVTNLKMQLQLLDNTTGAYEINNKDKEKALWQRFWHWMDKHRVLTIWWSALLGTGMLWVGTIIWWPLGAWIATWLLATKMWVMSAAKKASHYTKEQKGQEKRLTHGLNIEKQNLENIRKVMEWAPWYSWRKRKSKRQYKLYQEATQHRIADTEHLTKNIQSILSSTADLTKPENKNDQDALKGSLVSALVRLDYYKECWHNFVASQNRTKIEQDFNTLYKAVQDGVFRLNESMLSTKTREQVIKDWIDDIRTNDSNYQTLHDALKNDYKTSLTAFKRRRWSLERRYRLGSFFIYGWSALLMQRMLWSWVLWHHTKTITTPSTTSTTLHPQVRSSLASSGVPSSKITAIESALKSAPTSWWSYNPEAFWTILKTETWWTDAQLNNWMSNHFMKNVLWHLNEWWASEFKNALLSAHINTLSPGDPLFIKAETFLSSPKIWILRPWEWTTVLKNLQDYLSWAKSYSSFSPDMRIKMWHFGHMAIHNDIGGWSRLSKELLNTITRPWQSRTKTRDKHYFFDGIGMPIYANTYRKRMIPNNNEKWVELKNTDPGVIPEWDEFITADPNWSSSWPSSGAWPSWI